MKKSLSLLLFLTILSIEIFAQKVTNYQFVPSSSTFTALSSSTTATLAAGNTDDGYFVNIPIGFSFTYNSTAYSSLSVSTNGFVCLGQNISNVNSQTNNLTTGTTPVSPRPILAPLWDDNDIIAASNMSYSTTGTAPNRIFTVQWLNVKWQYNASTAGISFQLKLYEFDSKIEYYYRPESGSLLNPSASIGITGLGTGSGNFISIQSTGNNPYDTSTITESTSLSSKPANGQRYSFIPQYVIPTAPSTLSFSAVAPTSMNIGWIDSTASETFYKIYISTDSINFNLLSTIYSTSVAGIGTPYQYSATGLSIGTTYYFRVYVGNEGSIPVNYVSSTQSTLTGILSGTKTICPTGCNYTSIGAAAADIRSLGVNTSLILELDSTYNSSVETYPLSFGSLLTSATNVVTLRPRSNVTSTINFISTASSTFDFNGTDFLTIDGRKGGGGTAGFINISNFNGIGTAIRFQNDAVNNTIEYCRISGASSSITSGVINFLSTTGTLGNSNNTITNCTIKDTISNPIYAIYSSGNSGYPNLNNTVSNNIINDYFNGSNPTYGVYLTTGTSSWTINSNQFFQTSQRPLSYNNAGAVFINSGASYVINGNHFGGSAPLCAGNPMYYSGTGNITLINLNLSTNNTCDIQNNTIQNLKFDVTGSTNSLINLINGDFNITGNIIGSTTSTNNIRFTSSSTNVLFLPINLSSGTSYGTVNISSNSIGGISIGGTGTIQFLGINISAVVPSLFISNNIIGSLTTANSISDSTNLNIYGIAATLSSTGNIISGNIVSNLTTFNTSTSNQLCGIYASSTGSFSINGNLVKNLSSNTSSISTGVSAAIIGILLNASGSNQTCSGNVVSGLFSNNTTLAMSLTGIHFQAGATGVNVAAKNIVNGIVSASSGSSLIYGILNASNGSTIYNNMVRLGLDTSGNDINLNQIFAGINDAGNSNNYYFNSVYIGGSAVTSGSNNTAAFFNSVASTGTRTVVNNIFYNARSNNISSGKNYAIELTSVTLTGLSINYNIYYTPGVGGTLGTYYGTDYTVLNVWRSTIFNDFNSAIGNPNFVSPAGASSTLSLKVQGPTAAESSGLLIAGITDDFEGDNRSSNTPTDIGADAGNYTSVDIFSPVISYTSLTNTSTTTNRILVATITDIGLGVKNTGSLQPRIWYRRSLPTFSSWYSTPGTLTSGNVNNGTWTFIIDYSLISGSVTTGNQYQYYIVAQDSATPINLSYNPLLGTSHTNVYNQVSAPTNPNSYSIVTGLSTSINVGAGQTYTTLTGSSGLFNAINSGALSGNTVATIVSDINEPGTVALFNNGMSGYTLTIKPDATPRLLYGSTTTGYLGLISIYGASGVIIDGGTSRNLTIRNVIGTTPNNSTAPAVYYYNGNNDTIRNCIIESNAGSTGYATLILSNSSVSNPMSGMVITNNFVRPPSNVNTNSPAIAMMIYSAAGNISNSTISANRISDYSTYGLYIGNAGNNLIIGHPTDTSQGNSFIQTISRGWHYNILIGSGNNHIVSSNSIYNASGVSHTGTVLGIYVYNAINNITINNNSIGGTSKNRAGSSYLSGASFFGIYFTGGSIGTSTISNNSISNISLSGASQFYGIYNVSGNVNVLNNIIGGSSITGNTYDVVNASQDFYGFRQTTSSNLTMSGNVISNILNSGTGITTCMSIEAGVASITGNIVRDITVSNTSYTNADYSCNAIRISTSTSGNNIENNTLFNLTNNSNTASANVTAIAVMGAMNSTFIQRNRIYNLNIGSINTGVNSPLIWGIYIASTGSSTYANNQITINVTSATQPRIRGIELATSGGTNNFYYNSVYVGGNATGANTTTAFFRNTTTNTAALDVKNNIFYNERNAGGPHYAMSSASTVNFLNNNNLFVATTANPIEYPVGTARTLAGWNVLAGNPANNLSNTNTQLNSSQFFTNIGLGNLATSACRIANAGVPVAITNDFNNASRSTSTPDIGSVEFTTAAGYPTIVMQPVMPAGVCSSGGITNLIISATGFNITYQWMVNDGTGWTNAVNGIVYSGATTNSFSIINPTLSYNNYRYRCLISGTCNPAIFSDSLTLIINVPVASNTISSAQTICSGNTPSILSGSTPTGGNGSTYTYQWLSSTTSATSGFVVASGTSTSQNYSPSLLTQTTWFRRLVTSGVCLSDTSAAIQITVNPVISYNTVSSSQTICSGNTPSTLVGSTPSGGTGTYTYLWQVSTTNAISGFTAAGGTNTSQNYSPSTLTQTTWYRRVANSGTCAADTSVAIQITINVVVANNTISGTQTICSGNTPSTLSGSAPAGGNGSTYIYQWLSSTINATSGFATASGTNTSQNYSPTALAQTTWFKRMVTSGACSSDTTSAIQITVNPTPSTPVVSSNTPVCTNSTINLSTATVTGASYAWTGPNSFSSSSQNPNISSASSANSGTYLLTVNVAGCISSAGSTTVAVNNAGTWTGTASSAWNNTANWSCPALPTSSTNVVINSASNMPVITDVQFANNITIGTGASLTLNVAASQLSVFGNITNNGTFLNSNGKLVFSGSSSQTINSGTYNKIQINNSTSGVGLGGNILLNDSLILTSGNLFLSNYNLTLGNNSYSSQGYSSSYVVTNGTGTITSNNIGTSGKTGNTIFPVGNSAFNPITINNTGTADAFTVKIIDSITNSYSGSVPTGTRLTSNAVNKTWVVNEAVTGGSNATIILQWNASDELSGFNRTNSYVGKYTGSYWNGTSTSAASGSNPYIQTRSGILNFNEFGVASGGALPVELISFTGKKVAKNVQLNWVTSSEINNEYFEIQRSEVGGQKLEDWQAIGKVKGNGTSNEINNYQFTDDISTLLNKTTQSTNRQISLYYRLKQVDFNEQENISNIIGINLDADAANSSVLILPNPFTRNFTIITNAKTASKCLLQVYDVNGKLLFEKNTTISEGIQSQTIDELSETSPGFYYLRITIEGKIFTQKLVKSDKE